MKNCYTTVLVSLTTLISSAQAQVSLAQDKWTIGTQQQWVDNTFVHKDVEIKNGQVTSNAKTIMVKSHLKVFENKRNAAAITINQSSEWANWQPATSVGPMNLRGAPVALQVAPGNYWMFGLYKAPKEKFDAESIEIKGFDEPLVTTPYPNVFNAPVGLKKTEKGYHAWHSKDFINWVHYGPVSDRKGRWMTTAEYVDGKAYLYYDFPNDQDPHLIIDDDLTDGKIGKRYGMVFKDPSHGSDTAIIRDLDGKFHLIYEDWSPIDASRHAWDSPLAGHAVSEDGKGNFKILAPAVDERTQPTGKFSEYLHPHWLKEDPANYTGKTYTGTATYHGIKPGEKVAFGEYEIHQPAQNAYGDWAAIAIGGQYYLFSDFDPATSHPKKSPMSVAWFTSSSIDKPFTFSGQIGRGHPDPDIIFAEGEFYLVTQRPTDFVSPGPWVESVDVRAGVDTDGNGGVDKWIDWHEVKEHYAAIPGFSKQIAKTPARLDLSGLPPGYGFQFELRITDTTDNPSKPIIDTVELIFN
ncbi:hypothetical protein B5G52_06905 [Pseudoalteromonas sp. A601]|uniref:hypothetical protein n=1 Tax=Pseudoalteromonas sp. A601 TaxID=1967839 RepID=UPI000B3BDE35|nr:hypothetical protein [Pseudoalteromonas sp. A601]OUS72903.1 hypothetical protein B5G52_06905 [Pseudoalteromonas sp. A601]